MRVEKVMCDREGCKNEGALPYSIFKERRSDGAGSMETLGHTFDLCSHCTSVLLTAVLGHYDQFRTVLSSEQLLAFVVKFRIKTRVS